MREKKKVEIIQVLGIFSAVILVYDFLANTGVGMNLVYLWIGGVGFLQLNGFWVSQRIKTHAILIVSFCSSLAILVAATIGQSTIHNQISFFYMNSVPIMNVAILLLLSQNNVAEVFPQRQLNSDNSSLVPFLVFVQLFFVLFILFMLSHPYGYFTSWAMIFLNQALIIVVLTLLAIPLIVSHIDQSWYLLLALNVWFFVLSVVGIGTIVTQPYSIAVEQEYAGSSILWFTSTLGPGLLLNPMVLGILAFTMPSQTPRKKKLVSTDLNPASIKNEEPEETNS